MRRIEALLLALAAALALPADAAAQTSADHILSLGLAGGVAGSLDEDDTGFSNGSFQVRFGVETHPKRRLGIRLGRMDFGTTDVGPVTDMTVDHLTVAGEYLFDEPSYQSGLFLGLGFFDLSSTRFDGRSGDESGLGLVIGALGDFDLSRRWFLFGELSFAYTNLDVAQFYSNLQVGVGYRF